MRHCSTRPPSTESPPCGSTRGRAHALAGLLPALCRSPRAPGQPPLPRRPPGDRRRSDRPRSRADVQPHRPRPPPTHTTTRNDWYDVLHTSWLATLTEWGVAATLCEQTDPTRERAFLCFLRRTKGDLLLHETKIGGSAQKRSRHAILQHGSLLLDQSPAAPELPGISQLTSRSLDAEELTRSWTGRLAVRLGISWSAEALTDDERNRASAFDRDRYANSSWTLRR